MKYLIFFGTRLQDSTLVTGTQALVSDAINVFMILTASVTALIVMYNLFRQMAVDEQEKPKYKKGWKTALIIGVCILLTEVIINVIFSYYTK